MYIAMIVVSWCREKKARKKKTRNLEKENKELAESSK